MGSYVFKWPHPADDVHITGNFDDWAKSVQMYKKGDVWEREVDFPSADQKVLYKFVVDGEWIYDHEAPTEGDGHYNTNNVLYPYQITRKKPLVLTEKPDSTTPAEPSRAAEDAQAPGAFPETPSVETSSSTANPITASSSAGLPASATVFSIGDRGVGSGFTALTEDKEKTGSSALSEDKPKDNETFSINPIPASSGIGNPITLPSGAAVPPVTDRTIDSGVTTSKEDFEKAGSSAFPAGTTKDNETFSVNPIPASSGIGNPIDLPAGAPVPAAGAITSGTIGGPATYSKEDYEKAGSSAIPSSEPKGSESYSVQPIPASEGVGNPIDLPAGAAVPPASEVTPHTIGSTVTTSKDDYENAGSSAFPSSQTKEPESFGVNPIPASSGIGNPVDVGAGEPVPPISEVTPNTIDSTVTTSKEDYEKAGSSAFPYAAGAAGLGAAVVGGAAASSAFSKPEEKKNLIPESSLPMGAEATNTLDAGPFISSSGPGSTTADLAAKVPLEPKRDVTTSSVAPESTTTGLAANVPLEPKRDPTMSSVTPESTTAGLAAQVPMEPKRDPFMSSVAPESTTTGLAADVPLEPKLGSTLSSAGPTSTTAGLAAGVPLEAPREALTVDPSAGTASSVPAVVEKSIADAHQSPEAATSPEAVKDKSAFEQELLSKVPESSATGQSAKAATMQSSYYGLATSVPVEVEESMQKANAAPEAAADASIVAEKSAFERELLAKVPVTEEAGEPAPTLAAATSTTVPSTTTGVADLTDGKVANEPIPDTDTSSSARGLTAGEIAGGAVVGGAATAGAAAAVARHHDADAEPPRIADSQKPLITSEESPATATTATAVHPGQSTGAAAAVSDGADSSDITSVPKSTAPIESSDAATTEYAPVRTGAAIPGVSSAAAAAISDGTEDPTLSEEPAVKYMHQNEVADVDSPPADPYTAVTSAAAPTTVASTSTAPAPTDVATVDPAASSASGPSAIDPYTAVTSGSTVERTVPATEAVATETPSATVATVDPAVGESSEPVAVDPYAAATTAAGASATAPVTSTTSTTAGAATTAISESKVTSATSASTSEGDKTGGIAAATSAAYGIPTITSAGTDATKSVEKTSTPSTPVKKQTPTSAASSPATSTGTGPGTDKKKKRHRLSAFIKKVFDQ